MGPFYNRHGNNKNSDTGHGDFLNSTCDIGNPLKAPHSVRTGMQNPSLRHVHRNYLTLHTIR